MKFSRKQFLIISSVIVLAVVTLVLLSVQPSKADSADNIFGFAWAGAPQSVSPEKLGIGWISFNCNSAQLTAPRCSGSNNYGINIESDGHLTGYAYFDINDPSTATNEVGWIDFSPTVPDMPGSSDFSARVDLNGSTCGGIGNVCGWARALNYGGGWDGWIKLRKDASDAGANYGVYIDTSTTPAQFKGWAWGGDVMGWISFNCSDRGVCGSSNYKIETNFSFATPPVASDLRSDSISYCTALQKKGYIALSWLYSSGAAKPQQEYRLQVAADSSFNNLVIDKTIAQTVNPGSRGTSGLDVVSSPTAGQLEIAYNTNYWVRVKVKDTNGTWSDNWSNTINLTTASHAWPWPDFSWTPTQPAIGETTIMANNSKCFDMANNETSCNSWHWTKPSDATFVDATSANSQNPHLKFASIGNNSVTLDATDGLGTCSRTKMISIKLPLPGWIEIQPK